MGKISGQAARGSGLKAVRVHEYRRGDAEHRDGDGGRAVADLGERADERVRGVRRHGYDALVARGPGHALGGVGDGVGEDDGAHDRGLAVGVPPRGHGEARGRRAVDPDVHALNLRRRRGRDSGGRRGLRLSDRGEGREGRHRLLCGAVEADADQHDDGEYDGEQEYAAKD